MSDQSETTNPPSSPRLCKMGCGFFGSNATGDCCSKCWGDEMRRQGKAAEAVAKPVTLSASLAVSQSDSTSAPMEIEEKPAAVVAPSPEKKSTPAVISTKKKSKKKSSYKSMMAGIVQGGTSSRDSEKEKEQIRKVTGGGAFSKIEKI